MVKIYVNLCIKGVRNFNSVPENLKEQVREELVNAGYIINEDGSVVLAE